MMLSILIPCIPDRLDNLKNLYSLYEGYIKIYYLTDLIEIVSIVDNKQRTIGAKRNSLLSIANGDYIVISDDDDELTQAYFKNILDACSKGVDVITYLQSAGINGEWTTVHFGLKNENQEFNKDGVTVRKAWHCCTWRRALLEGVTFADINYGEDGPFSDMANEKAKTSYHINEICHVYEHDSTKTASFDERSN